jgi:SAM-dependent methyltransferase
VKPRPPAWSPYNAAAFELSDVVEHYHLRAPYPSNLVPFLRGLAASESDALLELGCGTGEISRRLAPYFARIDAIDISGPMLARARTMPNGDHPAVRWIQSRAEDAPLRGPYALAVAGASLHWMNWEAVLPLVARHLAPGAVLAIVGARDVPGPWADGIREIAARYSVIRNWESADLIGLLESRALFKAIDKQLLEPEPYTRTVDEFIAAAHATSGLAAERMTPEQVIAFRTEMRALLTPYASDGVLQLASYVEADWGTPLDPEQ